MMAPRLAMHRMHRTTGSEPPQPNNHGLFKVPGKRISRRPFTNYAREYKSHQVMGAEDNHHETKRPPPHEKESYLKAEFPKTCTTFHGDLVGSSYP